MPRYFYYATESALAAIWSDKLKISAPVDFNDPMEFLPATAEVTEKSRQWCTAFHAASRNSFYALCMSSSRSNPRMWAQYAGNHSGLMFTFDFSKGHYAKLISKDWIRKVIYNRPRRHVVDPRNVGVDDIFELLSRKGKDWEHERESRLLLTAESLVAIGGEYQMLHGHMAAFIPLPHVIAITLGHRSSNVLADSLSKIKNLKKASWEIRKAKLDDHKFAFVDEPTPP